MYELYKNYPQTPIRNVVIPGTHESGSYGISWISAAEPGERTSYATSKPLVATWAKTQFLNVYQQLEHGIRYLDLRIAFDDKQRAVIAHGLVSTSLNTVLKDIRKFSIAHPKEIILLRYTLSSDYTSSLPDGGTSETSRATQLITQYFGSQILNFSQDATFNDFWSQNKSIMIFIDSYNGYWPNCYTLHGVESFLDRHVQGNIGDMISDTQLIYTPPTKGFFFVENTYWASPFLQENSLSKYSTDLRARTLQMLRGWHSRGYILNVVTTDFFDKIPFVETLLQFNKDKLRQGLPF